MIKMTDFHEKKPRFESSAFIHPSSFIIGDVEIGEKSSVWPFAAIRGDVESIRIGERSNVQDGCVLHVDHGYPLKIGDDVTLGHGAIVHGATVEDSCIIGIRSTVLNGCVIGEGSIVGAGAVVTPGKEIPPGSMVLGVPAKVKKRDSSFLKMAKDNADEYVRLSRKYM